MERINDTTNLQVIRPQVIGKVCVMVKFEDDTRLFQTVFSLSLEDTVESLKKRVRQIYSIDQEFDIELHSALLATPSVPSAAFSSALPSPSDPSSPVAQSDPSDEFMLDSIILLPEQTLEEVFYQNCFTPDMLLTVSVVHVSEEPRDLMFTVALEQSLFESIYEIKMSSSKCVRDLKEKIIESFSMNTSTQFELEKEPDSILDEEEILGNICESRCWLNVKNVIDVSSLYSDNADDSGPLPIEIHESSQPVPELVLPEFLRRSVESSPASSSSLLFGDNISCDPTMSLLSRMHQSLNDGARELEDTLDRIFGPVKKFKSTQSTRLCSYLNEKIARAECPELSVIMRFIRMGADPNTVDSKGNTALLIYLLQCEEPAITLSNDLKELIRVTKHCTLQSINGEGVFTPLHIAVGFCEVPLIQAILNTGKYEQELDTILSYALSEDESSEILHKYMCDWETFKCLADAGANLYTVDKRRDWTLLDIVEDTEVSCNEEDAIRIREYLVEEGVLNFSAIFDDSIQ